MIQSVKTNNLLLRVCHGSGLSNRDISQRPGIVEEKIRARITDGSTQPYSNC